MHKAWNGVRPTCVQERWLRCKLEKQPAGQKLLLRVTETSPNDDDLIGDHLIPFPGNISGRVLGQPVCIGCHNHLLILQYNTTVCAYSRFLLVDLNNKTIQTFEDSEHYVRKEFFKLSPVECLIIPGLNWVLFRLPQQLLTSNRLSYMPCAKLSRNGDGRTIIEDLRYSFRKDRANQALTFHAKDPDCLTAVTVDIYKYSINIHQQNLTTKETLKQSTCRFGAKSFFPQQSLSESSSSDDEDLTESVSSQSFKLKHCSAEFSRGGELLVLCCVLINEAERCLFNQVFIFNAETFSVVKHFHFTSMSRQAPAACAFSSCGTRLEFLDYSSTHEHCLRRLIKSFELPIVRPPTLQEACRVTILRKCHSRRLKQLGLPDKMLSFLCFFQGYNVAESSCSSQMIPPKHEV